MKIGVFDSGLGGVIILKAIRELLPRYDFLYLGDTERLPYGKLSQEKIYQYTTEAMDYLFGHDCQLIVIACNTISTRALRRIQREYLPVSFPDRRVLGVVVPTVETVNDLLDHRGSLDGVSKIGVLGTQATVRSKAYIREFKKINSNLSVVQRTASRLVRLIEDRADSRSSDAARSAVKTARSPVESPIKIALKIAAQPLIAEGVQAIVLGCTHYCLVKGVLRSFIDPKIQVVSQDEVIPLKLADYLQRHPEIESRLDKADVLKSGRLDLRVTKLTAGYEQLANTWFGSSFTLQEISLTKP